MSDLLKKQIEIDRAWGGLGNWWDRKPHWRRTAKRIQEFRTLLCERQNWRCCYCGKILQLETKTAPDSATLEHVIPRAHGGPDREENIVIACFECNNGRGDTFSQPHIELLGMYERGEIA